MTTVTLASNEARTMLIAGLAKTLSNHKETTVDGAMVYVHHVPKASDADALSRVVAAAMGSVDDDVSPSVSRTAEFSRN
jgi:hypothetical protein